MHLHIDRLVVPATPRGQVAGAPRAPADMIVQAVGRALRTRGMASHSDRIASAVAEAVGRAQSSARREPRPTQFMTGGNVRGGKAT
jgi:hypothetical protein